MSEEEIIDKLEKYTKENIPCDSCRYCAERPNVNYCVKELLNLYKELKKELETTDNTAGKYMTYCIKYKEKIAKLEEENEMLKGMFKKSIKE